MSSGRRWPADRAWAWFCDRGWLCGANYVPSTAVNPIEMWASDTFDPVTIYRELGWAASLGFNSLRVFLHYFAWEADADGLLARFDEFLTIAKRHHFSTMVCLFDDCAHRGKQPHHGTQDAPVPGVHNSGWTPSPGHALVEDDEQWAELAAYVTGVMTPFMADKRICAWDIYNEPGNAGMGRRSLPLLREAFHWARSVNPMQPLTSGVWDTGSDELRRVNETMLSLSDIITFHHYSDAPSLKALLPTMQDYGRPLLCTEWMARGFGSMFATHLPIFRREGVGCYCWGLVNGKTQTHYPWNSPAGAPEPAVWHHDVLRRDGTPYHDEEVAVIRQVLGTRAENR